MGTVPTFDGSSPGDHVDAVCQTAEDIVYACRVLVPDALDSGATEFDRIAIAARLEDVHDAVRETLTKLGVYKTE